MNGIQTGQLVAGSWNSQQLGDVPTRLAGVPSAIAGVEVTLSALAQSVVALTERLEKSGVLMPSAVKATGNSQPTPPAYATSLANAIDRFRAQATVVTHAVSELQERIDL